MGDKNEARATAKKFKVPVIPGTEGIVNNVQEASEEAAKIGYPVMIKASAGGGGKGMRPCFNESNLESSFQNARN